MQHDYREFGNASPTSTLQWQKNTQQLLMDAKSAQMKSTKQRTVAFDTQATTDDSQLNTSRASVMALEEKIRESADLAKRATNEVSELIKEEGMLDECMRDSLDFLVKLEDPLKVAEAALQLRKGRPLAENTADIAERALLEQVAGAKHSMRMLNAVLDGGRKEKRNLEECRKALENDIRTKNASTAVDISAVKLQDSADSRSGLGRTQPSTGHTMQWRLNTENLIHDGKRTRAASQRLRERIVALLKESMEMEKSTRKGSITALTHKTEETYRHRSEVDATLADVMNEIDSLQVSIETTGRAHADLNQPLNLAQARLVKRAEKPANELVLDYAETSLGREINDLQYSKRMLQQQHDKQVSDLRKLQASMMKMETAVNEKTTALEIDLECIRIIEELETRL